MRSRECWITPVVERGGGDLVGERRLEARLFGRWPEGADVVQTGAAGCVGREQGADRWLARLERRALVRRQNAPATDLDAVGPVEDEAEARRDVERPYRHAKVFDGEAVTDDLRHGGHRAS